MNATFYSTDALTLLPLCLLDLIVKQVKAESARIMAVKNIFTQR